MNRDTILSWSPWSPLSLFVLAIAAASCGDLSPDDPGWPRHGAWIIGSHSGEITIVDSGGHCTGSWTFEPDQDHSGNLVRVLSRGEVEFTINFLGVEGSPHPDGLSHGDSGHAEYGEIFGHTSNETLGVESSWSGTYDGNRMEATWTMTQHVGGSPGECTTTLTGSGSFDASPLQ